MNFTTVVLEKEGEKKDPCVIKLLHTGVADSKIFNFCKYNISNHCYREKVKVSGIKINGIDGEICCKLACMPCRE